MPESIPADEHPTDETEPAVTSVEDAAKELEEYAQVRVLPSPPGFLFRDQIHRYNLVRFLMDEERARSDRRLAIYELVAPHWNAAVQRLNQGENGYASLIQLRNRLQQHVESEVAKAKPTATKAWLLERVQWAFGQAIDTYGEDALVGESLGDPPVQTEKSEWLWSLGPGSLYILDLDRNHARDDLKEVWDTEAQWILNARSARADETWESASAYAAKALEDAQQRLVPLDHKRDVIRFRLRIVEQVLLEYEVLGHVSELSLEENVAGDDDERRVEPPDISYLYAGRMPERLLFIVLAHEAIQADPERELSRSALLSGKGKETIGGIDGQVLRLQKERPDDFGEGVLQWYVYESTGKASYLAHKEPIHAFWKTSDRGAYIGDDGEPLDRCTRDYFDERIEELYAEISAAGVRTIDDVVPYLHGRQTR